jgi:hypothetical protein
MPDLALFVAGSLITLVVAAGCFKLGLAEEAESRRRERERQLQQVRSR